MSTFIFYNDNTIFIVIEENVGILAQLQKLFLSIYNKKLYFTCINSFEMWRKETALVNAVLVIGSNLYSKLIEIKEIIIESTLQIFIITETVINYEVPINAKIIPPKLLGKILIEHQ